MLWKLLSREDDLLAIVKNTDNLKQLVSLKRYLGDELATQNLRHSTVHKALKAIDDKLDIKEIGLKEILEMLL